MERIIKNAAQCRLCKEILVSDSVHDFKTCKCGEISVDGGTDYIRRCYTTDIMNIIELSEFEEIS